MNMHVMSTWFVHALHAFIQRYLRMHIHFMSESHQCTLSWINPGNRFIMFVFRILTISPSGENDVFEFGGAVSPAKQ